LVDEAKSLPRYFAQGSHFQVCVKAENFMMPCPFPRVHLLFTLMLNASFTELDGDAKA
jgi:hypothetical protein